MVRGEDGRLWTPNGRHRLAAAKVLGLKQITALISPDDSLAYRILALNTEKAHNLKDRSLEVIRMARNLAKHRGREPEEKFVAEFEAAELLTLGVVYEKNPRFAGGAYSSFLKKVDRFSERTLAASLRQREDYAARLIEIDTRVKAVIAGLTARGFKSPYLRNYVVARINPVRFHKAKKGETRAGDADRPGIDAHGGRRPQLQPGLRIQLRPRLGGGRGFRGLVPEPARRRQRGRHIHLRQLPQVTVIRVAEPVAEGEQRRLARQPIDRRRPWRRRPGKRQPAAEVVVHAARPHRGTVLPRCRRPRDREARRPRSCRRR